MDYSQKIKIYTPNSVYSSLTSTELKKYKFVLEIKSKIDSKGWVNLCISYKSEDSYWIYMLLKDLYKADSSGETIVFWQNEEYHITDSKLHKLIILEDGGMDCNDYISHGSLKNLIKEHNVKTLKQLSNAMALPFSLFYDFDDVDQVLDLRIFHGGRLTSTGQSIELKHCKELVFSNRHIKTKIVIKKTKNVEFHNCYIETDISCFEVENVAFIDCIFVGKLCCSYCSSVKVNGCNIQNVLFSVNRLSMLQIAWSKIYELNFFDSDVPHFSTYKNHINQISVSASNLHDNKIPISQLNEARITLFNYFIKKSLPSKKWYLSFCVDEPTKFTNNKTHMLDTIDVLLNNCDFEYRHKEKSNLKYKRMLYSNSGLKKLFIQLTGGFYKPFLWILYFVAISIIFTFLYTLPYCLFSDGSEVLAQGLSPLTAVYYTLLQILGENILGIKPQGIAAILSAIQVSLNKVVVASFFTTIIKKYMD